MKDEGPLIPESLLEYLESSTKPELEQFEMLRLGRSADLAKYLLASIRELVRAEAEALVARMLIERRKAAKNEKLIPAAELLAELIPDQPKHLNGEAAMARRKSKSPAKSTAKMDLRRLDELVQQRVDEVLSRANLGQFLEPDIHPQAITSGIIG